MMLLLRLVPVVRLAMVLTRTMMMLDIFCARLGAGGWKLRSLSEITEAVQAKLPGYRGTGTASRWEQERRQECDKPDVNDTGLAEETSMFLSDPQNKDVVRLLTGNFNTLLNVFQKLDKTKDGSLSIDEFVPGMRSLGLTKSTAERFMIALDVDQTGGVEVAELFRAGAFLCCGRLHAA